jgi:hypothetical protein
VNFAFPRLVFGAGPAEPDRAAGGRLPSRPRRAGMRGLWRLGVARSWPALPCLGCRLGLWVLMPGGLAAYPAGFGLGLAVHRAFIILPMRCSALALAWM